MRYLILTAISAFMLNAPSAFAEAPVYTGNVGCKCHKQQYEEFQNSIHARAFDQLLAAKRSRKENKALKDVKLDHTKDYDDDPKCLECHTTGFNKPGGYSGTNMKDDLKGVGCESCHGPGSLYRVLHKEKEKTFTVAEAAALGEVYPPSEEDCRKCHDNQESVFSGASDPKYAFDFKKRLENGAKAWHTARKLLYKH
ncbi:MAG: hypothetical protein HY804_12750 [Nitrospinae bacterium]|nr:hypothetical protein [Nitrospinota bacterium]